MPNRRFVLLLLTWLGSVAAVAQSEPQAEEINPLDQTVPVADADTGDSGDGDTTDAVDSEAIEEDLLDAFARYRQLINEGTLDEADTVAKRIVEMAIRIYGPRSTETASALNNLAIVQHSNGQYEAAIQNFRSSVEILEKVDNRLASSLVNPLKGLGASQLAAGRPDRANRTLNRAAHITQVNEGPHNIGQVEILESIAETFIRMGDIKSARNLLDRIHVLNVRFYEKDPMGLIPSLMNRATWQHRAGFYNDERASYRRAIRIVEAAGGKYDPMLIEPLRRLGQSFYFIDLSSATPNQQGLLTTGEVYFKRAARIAERAEDIDWRVLADTKLALADYYTYSESTNRARKVYREIWEYLSENDTRLEYRDEVFGAPVPIRTEPLPEFAGSGGRGGGKEDGLQKGRITVEYTVSSRGRVRDLKTEADPPEFTDMQRMVHREIRTRVFRPRFIDATATESVNQVFEHNFSFLESDLEAIREMQQKEAAAKPGARGR